MKNNSEEKIIAATHLVLESALPNVKIYGWTETVFNQAVKSADLGKPLVSRIFPNGLSDLVMEFYNRIDDEMLILFNSSTVDTLKYSERISLAIKLRFKAMEPYREVTKQAIAYHAIPSHNIDGMKSLANTSNLIWEYLEDTSTDFNYYTKRITLAGVIASTTLVWVNDIDNTEWPNFLNRRLKNVSAIKDIRHEANKIKESVTQKTKSKIGSVFPSDWTGFRDILSIFSQRSRR